MNSDIKRFFDFVAERHAIWDRRFMQELPPPWTDDPILQKYKFCNVYRDLDRGTQWIAANAPDICKFDKKLAEQDKQNVIYQVVCYRLLNNSDFFEKHPMPDLDEKPWDSGISEQTLREYKKECGYLFNTAYTTFKTFNNATGLKDTIKSYCAIIEFAYRNIESISDLVLNAATAEGSCKSLESIPGVGAFLAYEIWCDLILLKVHKWGEDDYCNVGQGAVAGLRIIYPEMNTNGFTNAEWVALCVALQKCQKEYLPADYSGKRLSLRSIEHSLCEFRKYFNLKLGKGRPRLFNPLT